MLSISIALDVVENGHSLVISKIEELFKVIEGKPLPCV